MAEECDLALHNRQVFFFHCLPKLCTYHARSKPLEDVEERKLFLYTDRAD